MMWRTEVLISGKARGDVLRLDAPISFWGGVDPATSQVTLADHPQHGQKIAGKMLVVPQLVGSSSSSAVMLELFYKGLAPKALILGARDAILPVGVIVARQMGWPVIPVVVLPNPSVRTGDRVALTADGNLENL